MSSNAANGEASSSSSRLRATMSLADMSGVARSNGVGGRRRDSFATSEEFVKRFGGKRAINKVLIANNGIAGERRMSTGMPKCQSVTNAKNVKQTNRTKAQMPSAT